MVWDNREKEFASALFGFSVISVFLFLIGVRYYDARVYWFLNWNLVLAWIPLLLSTTLVHYVKNKPWLSWQGVTLSILWLLFIPNSFYLITDLVHLSVSDSTSSLYYVVLFFSFAVNGLILGFTSLYQIQRRLAKRVGQVNSNWCVALVLLLCSFAIYLGRFLRWSTWDIVANPAGVLFDVSDRIINPIAHEQTFQITGLFFLLLGSLYILSWKMTNLLSHPKK